MSSSSTVFTKRMSRVFLVGTILGGWSAPILAQEAAAVAQPAPVQPAPVAAQPAPAPVLAPVATAGTIRSIRVVGSERLEPETVRSYANLVPGQSYTPRRSTGAEGPLRDRIVRRRGDHRRDTRNLVITVRENPVINRIVLEGNKRIKNDKIMPEIKLAPRQIFTRSKVRADVDRIIELYRRQGRFAASVEPKIIQLDQNRVDLIFEISEGDKSKVRAINIIGNEQYSDGRLRKEMFTKEAGGLLGLFKSNDSYDHDRLAADQQKLRAFYLTQGYADFPGLSRRWLSSPRTARTSSSPMWFEEGSRYKFGTVEAESDLRDFDAAFVKVRGQDQPGNWFNAKLLKTTVTGLNELAGARVMRSPMFRPDFQRDD